MHQSKFSLADVLIVLGAVSLGFICFLSFNFLSFGDTTQSIIWASVFALLSGGLAFVIKLLKRTSRNFKTCIIWEWALLLLFTGLFLVLTIPMSHYFVVSAKKAEIQRIIMANIEQAEGMFDDYENHVDRRLTIYKRRLNTIVSAKNTDLTSYRNYGFVDDISDSTQIEHKTFALKSQLLLSNYQEMKSIDSIWLASAKATVKNWKPIGLITVVKAVEEHLTKIKQQLKELTAFRAQGEDATDFDYPLTFGEVKGNFTELGSPNIISIVIIIALYLLMLLSYFITDRHTKHPGIFKVFLAKSTSQRTIITK